MLSISDVNNLLKSVEDLAWDTNVENPWKPINTRGYYIWADGLNHYIEYTFFERCRRQKAISVNSRPKYWEEDEFFDLNSRGDKKSFLEGEREIRTGEFVEFKIRSSLGISV
jgi:hypothetical protein